GMIIAGLGMGLLQPVYTTAVQNDAPREHLGAAIASTVFFRSIGSTLGVAIFGSVLLTIYKHDFMNAIPPGGPQVELRPFLNPMMLPILLPQLQAEFGKYPGGLNLLQTLFGAVRTALLHGLQVIFFVSAIVMSAGVLLNASLKEVPLRGRGPTTPDAG